MLVFQVEQLLQGRKLLVQVLEALTQLAVFLGEQVDVFQTERQLGTEGFDLFCWSCAALGRRLSGRLSGRIRRGHQL